MTKEAKVSQVSVGKCTSCKKVFSWKKKKGLYLDDVKCPICGGGLDLTQFKQKSLPTFSLDGYWPEHKLLPGGPIVLAIVPRYEYLVTYQYKYNSNGDYRECKFGLYAKSMAVVQRRYGDRKDFEAKELPAGTIAKLKATEGLGISTE
jgi:hypothetical protein